LVIFHNLFCIDSRNDRKSESHHTPDPFVVDFPAPTHQRLGYTVISIVSKSFTNRLDGGTKPMVSLLMIRLAAMSVIQMPIDQQHTEKFAYRI
jgi:hypothetical protein